MDIPRSFFEDSVKKFDDSVHEAIKDRLERGVVDRIKDSKGEFICRFSTTGGKYYFEVSEDGRGGYNIDEEWSHSFADTDNDLIAEVVKKIYFSATIDGIRYKKAEGKIPDGDVAVYAPVPGNSWKAMILSLDDKRYIQNKGNPALVVVHVVADYKYVMDTISPIVERGTIKDSKELNISKDSDRIKDSGATDTAKDYSVYIAYKASDKEREKVFQEIEDALQEFVDNDYIEPDNYMDLCMMQHTGGVEYRREVSGPVYLINVKGRGLPDYDDVVNILARRLKVSPEFVENQISRDFFWELFYDSLSFNLDEFDLMAGEIKVYGRSGGYFGLSNDDTEDIFKDVVLPKEPKWVYNFLSMLAEKGGFLSDRQIQDYNITSLSDISDNIFDLVYDSLTELSADLIAGEYVFLSSNAEEKLTEFDNVVEGLVKDYADPYRWVDLIMANEYVDTSLEALEEFTDDKKVSDSRDSGKGFLSEDGVEATVEAIGYFVYEDLPESYSDLNKLADDLNKYFLGSSNGKFRYDSSQDRVVYSMYVGDNIYPDWNRVFKEVAKKTGKTEGEVARIYDEEIQSGDHWEMLRYEVADMKPDSRISDESSDIIYLDSYLDLEVAEPEHKLTEDFIENEFLPHTNADTKDYFYNSDYANPVMEYLKSNWSFDNKYMRSLVRLDEDFKSEMDKFDTAVKGLIDKMSSTDVWVDSVMITMEIVSE